VALVDEIANRLADEVARNRVARQAVIGEQLPFIGDVFPGGGRGVDIEMIAPAGQLDSIVAHFFGERRELGERKVGPLAGE